MWILKNLNLNILNPGNLYKITFIKFCKIIWVVELQIQENQFIKKKIHIRSSIQGKIL